MAFFALAANLSSAPNKIKSSAIPWCVTPNHDHYYYSSRHTKARSFTLLSKQSIHLAENGKQQRKETSVRIRHDEAVEEVKRVLVRRQKAEEEEGSLCMMIDSIQRLGIDYHFEEEITSALQSILHHHLMLKTRRSSSYHANDSLKLSKLALDEFRLLRQGGYYTHLEEIDKFWDNRGKLKHRLLKEEVEGVITLFEAAQLRIEGEESFDKAGEWSRQYLCSYVSRFHDHPHAKVVAQTLRYPIHRSLPRFMPATSLKLEKEASGWASSLQELSKLDTQIVSSLHLNEIAAVTKWWKELGLSKELKFIRDEPIKWYMWPMACLPDPRFSEERIELTKPLSLIYVLDDIFDSHPPSIRELTLFTHAVNRWDLAAMDQLPDCMKVCFKALYDITNEFAFKTYIKHGWNPIGTLVKSWGRLMNAFLEEAKWVGRGGEIPKAEEYLKNGIVSTGVQVILVHAFFLMGQGITTNNVSLMNQFPTIISTVSTILRLCDDLQGDKEVNKDGNDGSYLKCYMKDNPGISKEETESHINDKISDAWKRLNQEWLTPTNELPPSFAKICLNAVRMVPLMYSYDGNSPSKLEEHVKSLLCGANLRTVPQDHHTPSFHY